MATAQQRQALVNAVALARECLDAVAARAASEQPISASALRSFGLAVHALQQAALLFRKFDSAPTPRFKRGSA